MKINWLYDEMKHSGVDYSSHEQVKFYDERHQKFRDYRKGAEGIIKSLNLKPEDVVIDIGAGTGAFAINAASYCRTIYAVDVSKAMLDYTRQKAEAAGIDNIVFCHGGFLTYQHEVEPADAMVCTGVLHHLPDFWKLIGLRRASQMLKPGGKLHLFDVVFRGNMVDYVQRFDQWVGNMEENVGSDFVSEVESHIRDEYSTFDWVMERILEQAGFKIDSANYTENFGATYQCTNQS